MNCPNIAINTDNGIFFKKESEILYFKAQGSYTHIYLEGEPGNKITVSKPLSRVLKSLQTDSFVRIHNSYAINLVHLNSFCKDTNNKVIMTNGEVLAVSRNRKSLLFERFRMV